mmetsp:Transcript_5622/g.7171  ORF Transcript_5622/g.7171 Transcript_5622/m.7171 type:complete len:1249 (+) Transcript_5622:539-4285(+)
MTPNHNHNPHHRHMLGSPLFDPNNINAQSEQNPQLAQIMNIMQSPPGISQFNPYRQHQSPHQRFPYMNPAITSYTTPADIMRFQQQQQQQQQQHSQRLGASQTHGSQFYNSSPVSSPEEIRKRAAQAQAQQVQAQAQQAHAVQQAQQGYFSYDPRHLTQPPQSLMNRSTAAAQGGNNSGFGYPHSHQQSASFQQFSNQVNESSLSSLPSSMQSMHNSNNSAYGNFMGDNNGRDQEGGQNNQQQEQHGGGAGGTGVISADAVKSSSPEKSSSVNAGKKSPEKSVLKSIVNALSTPNGVQYPSQTSSGEDVDLTPLGTILNSSPEGRGRGRGRGRGKGGRGRGRGRGRGKRGILSLTKTQPDGTIVPIDAEMNPDGSPDKNMPIYYTGSVSLGLEEDQYWLSELQVYLRSNFAEAFGATERDIAAPMHGRNKPIALGQVGIRCIHCKDEPPSARGQQAVSYPSLVSGIYNSVQQMFRLHFDCCTAMPDEVKVKIETLRASSSSRGGRKQYWIDSAKRLGLVDTSHGIHFGRDPTGPLPPLAGPSAAAMDREGDLNDPNDVSGAAAAIAVDNDAAIESPNKSASLLSQEHTDEIKRQKEEAYPLVLPEDKPLISEYLYLTLLQMEPCKLMDADRVGCYKGRDMGFRGLACKWCVGQAGCGRYFPASEASLSQTTTSQTILNHVRNCRRCPSDVRENLELMKRNKMGPDGKKYDKPKHGGRKVFFHRLWCRIQGLEIQEIQNVEVKIGRQKGAKNKKRSPKKRKKRKNKNDSDSETDSEPEESTKYDEDTETEDDEEEEEKKTNRKRKRNLSLGRKKSIGHIPVDDEESSVDEENETEEPPVLSFPGSTSLSKSDDVHWLSELQCFIRSDMVEAFSTSAEDIEGGYYQNVELLQVGIGCSYCAKLSPAERPEGHCYFPQSISTIQQHVSDLHRRHFSSCNEIPDDVRKSFKSLRGFAAKAEGETQQYWINSARELGLSNSAGSSGIRFFRNPLEQSPADELEVEMNNKKRKASAKIDTKSLIRPDDIATNHALLLLKQVRPCRFKNSDRRGGPGSRGRDRALGFPGIACIHCSSQNNFGRYFPFAAKSLGDNTYNSIQTHLATCSRCPEAVKAFLAYLSHRSILEKNELGGGWKKSFFKIVWDRLHVERAWTSKQTKESTPEEESLPSDDNVDDDDDVNKEDNGDEVEEGNNEGGNETMDGELGDMVKAAAQWLTDRDAGSESLQVKSSKSKGTRGRGLPSRFKGVKRMKAV